MNIRLLFDSPRRLWLSIALTILTILIIMAVVLAVRINQAFDRVEQAKASPAPTLSTDATLPPMPTTGPLTTQDQEYLATDDPFDALGDPTPVVLSAVAAWVRLDVEAMQKVYLPAALDSVVGTPPGRGFRVTGPAEVVEPGPTRSVLIVPTSVQPLEVVTVGVEGRWMVESIGYRR